MRKFLLVPVLAALAALGSLTLADAHSRPVRFDPAPGAVLDTAPAEVTGWFTSDIRRADESFIHVLDTNGNEVQNGDVELSTDRRMMSTALQSGLEEGRYVVYWSTFDDADGEIFADCYAFFVGQSAADAALESGAALDAAAECPAAAEEHSHDDGEADPNAASIEISIPEVVEGNSATLEIMPTNFTPRAPDGSTVDPNFGHYHIYLDKVPVDAITGEHSHEEGDDHADDMAGATGTTMEDMNSGADHEDDEHDMSENPGGLVENPVMWVENSYTFDDLEPGNHTVSVVLNHDDHTPFSPVVLASQTFRVEGDGSTNGSSAGAADGGSNDGGIPVWALALGVVGGLVVGGVGMKLVGSRA